MIKGVLKELTLSERGRILKLNMDTLQHLYDERINNEKALKSFINADKAVITKKQKIQDMHTQIRKARLAIKLLRASLKNEERERWPEKLLNLQIIPKKSLKQGMILIKMDGL